MFPHDYFLIVGMGCLFLLLGFLAILWGKMEEKGRNGYLSKLGDAREFLDRWPERPGLGALKVGGWIAVAVGILLLLIGIAFLFGGLKQ